MISVELEDVRRITSLIGAVIAQLPATPRATGPRGDLSAHAEKALQISRELHPPYAGAAPGTAGTTASLVTVDRTALERLDVELEAIEMLIPRASR